MHISRIELYNFRRYKEAKLELNPELCVFVGDNGSGKTTLLDALSILISRVFPHCDYMLKRASLPYASQNCRRTAVIKKGRSHTKEERKSYIAAQVEMPELGETAEESVFSLCAGTLLSVREYIHHERPNSLEHAIGARMSKLAEEGEPITAIAYYGPYRGALQGDRKRFGRRKINYTEPFSAYINALRPSLDFDSFLDWYNAEEADELRERRHDKNYESRELKAVRDALARVFDNAEITLDNPRFEANPKRFVMDQHMPDGSVVEIMFDQLSDGYRGMVALVADFARRLAICNRYTQDDPLAGNGVLMIDEIDVHLHPKWQYHVVDDLRRAFPNVQLIVTTHSAEVLSSVKKEHIYLLEKGDDEMLHAHHPQDETQGYYPDSIASEVMGTPELYREHPGFKAYLNCLMELENGQIDGEKYQNAQAAVIAHYGEESPMSQELKRREAGARRTMNLRARLQAAKDSL